MLQTFNGTSLEEVTVNTYVNLDHVYNIYYLAHQVAHHFCSLQKNNLKLEKLIYLMAPPWLCNVADSFTHL